MENLPDLPLPTNRRVICFADGPCRGRDIVVGNYSVSSAHLVVLMGNGDGTFFAGISTAASLNNSCLARDDFNHDGTNDVAVLNYDADTLTIFLGNGNGTLRSNAVYSVGANPQSIAVGNVSGDLNPDLLVGAGTNLTVLVGNGNGTCLTLTRYFGLERAIIWRISTGTAKWIWSPRLMAAAAKSAWPRAMGDGTFGIAPR